MSQDQAKKQTFQLNPAACEFVPTFSVGNSNVAASSNTAPSSVNSSNYHNKSNNRYNNNHGNNYHHNNHSGHYNNNNNNHQRSNNHYNHNHNNQNYYYGHNSNSNDVDPIEIEARCEAVIEILQDDQIRDHLNPQSSYPEQQNETATRSNNNNRHQNHHNQNHYYDDHSEPPFEDEEDLEEMLAMQEECRLEMMKFYIQSQNPKLFEEIYHDVSYPEGMQNKKTTTPPSASAQLQSSDANKEINDSELARNESNDPASSESDQPASLKDRIIDNLDTNSAEFTQPEDKLANLNLNEKTGETQKSEAK